MDWKAFFLRFRELLLTEIFTLSGTSISLATILIFVIIVAVTFVVAGLLQRGLEKVLMRQGRQDAGTAGALSRLLRYGVLVVGLSVGLQAVGINLSTLFAAGALFAVAIGFAMQKVVENFVSGAILLAERAIKPGDVLQVEGRMVRVVDMGIRATIVRTLDDEDLVIPNGSLVQSTVTNYTLQDDLYRLRAEVGVAYSSDMAEVRRILMEAARKLEWRVPSRDPVVLMTDFASSSVNYEVSVWVNNPWTSRRSRSDLREAIWWAFQEAGITIAFPQLDVHFDRQAFDGLRDEPVAAGSR